MTDLPKPVKFERKEGEAWEDWPERGARYEVHAILFEDGTVFDTVNGWRKFKSCPHCGVMIRNEY